MSDVVLARISAAPLDVAAHLDAVSHPAAGAVASFIGQVRDHDPAVDGTVARLEYEAHPDAEPRLAELARSVAGERPVRVAATHRVGTLFVGEIAVVVAVASAHRSVALDVCRELIETIKTDLPVWKRQVDDQGRGTWTGIADQPPANGGSTSTSSA